MAKPKSTSSPTTPTPNTPRVKAGHTKHTPRYHWHKYQSETLTFHPGTKRTHLEDFDNLIPAGQSITIELGLYHTFHNNSDTEPLVIFTGLDPTERERDEAFFRNLYSYLDDSGKVGIEPKVAHLMLFLCLFDFYRALKCPRWTPRIVSQAMVFLGGVVIGKWVLGFGRVMRGVIGLRVRVSRVGDLVGLLGCMSLTEFAWLTCWGLRYVDFQLLMSFVLWSSIVDLCRYCTSVFVICRNLNVHTTSVGISHSNAENAESVRARKCLKLSNQTLRIANIKNSYTHSPTLPGHHNHNRLERIHYRTPSQVQALQHICRCIPGVSYKSHCGKLHMCTLG